MLGFHCGPGGNRNGLGEYYRELSDAGIVPFCKSVDDYGACQECLDYGGIAVFRMTGGDLELPDYSKPPADAAVEHWGHIEAALPLEFDKRTWLEVMNEPDKGRAEWLAEFCWHIAHFMMDDGYKLAAFGWSSGEPEPEHWTGNSMAEFLQLAREHPDEIAIALHEYSFDKNDLSNSYPWLVGRFGFIPEPHPTILITEFGWELNDVGDASELEWAANVYEGNVLGAAIWYLGGGFGGIANKAQKLIAPVTEMMLTSGPKPDPKPEPEQRTLVINIDERGYGTVVLDGDDISNRVQGFEIKSYVGKITEVKLVMAPIGVEAKFADPRIEGWK